MHDQWFDNIWVSTNKTNACKDNGWGYILICLQCNNQHSFVLKYAFSLIISILMSEPCIVLVIFVFVIPSKLSRIAIECLALCVCFSPLSSEINLMSEGFWMTSQQDICVMCTFRQLKCHKVYNYLQIQLLRIAFVIQV